MAKKILDIPHSKKKMHIETDDHHGHLIGVTDEEGKPVNTMERDETKFKFGEIEAKIIDVPEHTTFVTQHNPPCRWVYINGKWYYLCG
ncbi:MAG: hypothetical protein HZA15_02245 [Nitrospirae bacterium]|nr:hypothetical protein [Nitrospirota bacterium]